MFLPRSTRTGRNLLVAALASEVWFAHITPGGQMAELAKHVEAWRNRSVP